jgi:hypothetical protein
MNIAMQPKQMDTIPKLLDTHTLLLLVIIVTKMEEPIKFCIIDDCQIKQTEKKVKQDLIINYVINKH